LFEEADGGFYDEHRGNCDVELKVRAIGGFGRKFKISLRGIAPVTALKSRMLGRPINTYLKLHTVKFA
jgi:hypothetical protein